MNINKRGLTGKVKEKQYIGSTFGVPIPTAERSGIT